MVDALICYKQKCKVASFNLAHPVDDVSGAAAAVVAAAATVPSAVTVQTDSAASVLQELTMIFFFSLHAQPLDCLITSGM